MTTPDDAIVFSPFAMDQDLVNRRTSPFRRHFAAVQPPFFRRLSRMPAGQLAFSLIGLLVICAMVAGTLASVGFDASRKPVDVDPTEYSDGTNALIDQQRKRVEENPEDAGAMALLGSLLASNGQLAEASRWYESALRLNPNDTATRLNFAGQLGANNRPFDAELQYQKVVDTAALPANQAQAHYGLAQLYENWTPPRLADAEAQYHAVAGMPGDLFISEQARQRLAQLKGGTPGATPDA